MAKRTRDEFLLAGLVTRPPDHPHGEAELPGKARVHIENEGGCYLAYVPSPPPPGSWVGLIGEWVALELGPAPGGVRVEYQVDATGWVSLPPGYDPLLDGDLQDWIRQHAGGPQSLEAT